MINEYRNLPSPSTSTCGCSKSNIQNLNPATCPPTGKKVGNILTLSATPTNGTAPFTIKFQRNSVDIVGGTFTGILLNQTKTIQYTLRTEDIPSVNISTMITDSCIDPGPQTLTDTCNVLVSSCIAPLCTFTLTYNKYDIGYQYTSLEWSDITIVSGTWIEQNRDQTIYDPLWVSPGYTRNQYDIGTNNNEFKLSSLTLNTGTYEIKVVGVKASFAGILEILHGTTVIGTADMYETTFTRDVIWTFTYYSLTSTTSDLRFRINGKNSSSTAYFMGTSQIQIRKTI